MSDHCSTCGATREDGFLIIEGKCMAHGPEKFEARGALLREQGRKLMEEMIR